MPPNTWTNPDYHWQPPADQAYTFDIAKANQLLDQAGYTRGPTGCASPRASRSRCVCGPRPTSRRARPRPSSSPVGCRSSASRSTSRCSTQGAFLARMFNYKGGDLRARLRHGPERLGRLRRPRRDAHLRSRPRGSAPPTNRPGRTPRSTSSTCSRRPRSTPATRSNLIWQMQQIFYQQSPQIVLVYPQYLQAYNTTPVDRLDAHVPRTRPGLSRPRRSTRTST